MGTLVVTSSIPPRNRRPPCGHARDPPTAAHFRSLRFARRRLRDELKKAELRGSSVAELEEEARRLTVLLKVR